MSVSSEMPADWQRLGKLQTDIQVRVRAAVGELGRMECLDEEERAEIHAILEAIRHDSESHARIIGTYISEAPNA
ncbi:MAG TPA: hypothetical protein VM389_15165 [Phycisphaerae bacterium]|nr:hypothetical protein [Phycisphaerae bacterium]HUU23874.1 hypothetical protein [Phycisphaerae bacterium]